MPYALFCNEARLSKTYPTEADVWKLARQSGLVVDVVTEINDRAPAPWLRPGRCSTTITRSGRAGRTRTRIPPGTRPKPNATPNWNSS